MCSVLLILVLIMQIAILYRIKKINKKINYLLWKDQAWFSDN